MGHSETELKNFIKFMFYGSRAPNTTHYNKRVNTFSFIKWQRIGAVKIKSLIYQTAFYIYRPINLNE